MTAGWLVVVSSVLSSSFRNFAISFRKKKGFFLLPLFDNFYTALFFIPSVCKLKELLIVHRCYLIFCTAQIKMAGLHWNR